MFHLHYIYGVQKKCSIKVLLYPTPNQPAKLIITQTNTLKQSQVRSSTCTPFFFHTNQKVLPLPVVTQNRGNYTATDTQSSDCDFQSRQKDKSVLTISTTSTLAGIRRLYMYCCRSFFICTLLSDISDQVKAFIRPATSIQNCPTCPLIREGQVTFSIKFNPCTVSAC